MFNKFWPTGLVGLCSKGREPHVGEGGGEPRHQGGEYRMDLQKTNHVRESYKETQGQIKKF